MPEGLRVPGWVNAKRISNDGREGEERRRPISRWNLVVRSHYFSSARFVLDEFLVVFCWNLKKKKTAGVQIGTIISVRCVFDAF